MDKKDSMFLKAIAVILLVIHHNPYGSVFGEVFQSGARVCVWIFLFISAYGFTIQIRDRYEKHPFKFIIRRIVLLYAQMWFFYLINLIVLLIFCPNITREYFLSSPLAIPMDVLNICYMFGKEFFTSYWYVNFLLVVITIFPLLYFIVKKMSWFSIPAALILASFNPFKLRFVQGGPFDNFLLIIVFGIVFAQCGVFEKLAKYKNKYALFVIPIGILFLSALGIFRFLMMPDRDTKWYLQAGPFSTAMTLILVLLVYLYRRDGKVSQLFQKLGTYSGNIFFIHTLYYNVIIHVIRMKDRTLVFATCFLFSLGVALLVELVKKKTKYNERVRGMMDRLLKDAR